MKLSDYMAQVGLTDQALADKVGVNRSNVTRWRNGDSKPSMWAMVQLKKVTKGCVTPNDFYDLASVKKG